ncbi:37S ribosomal protein S7, mitochondrial [Wickerhamiella sorbophila]|uniref:37S ribosomal protein S7, mitochondrial n=1 Tax=Wickerhamiella sorbophila TaxID=45607 RepID=A0A2T0FNH5_9ASCO|nr:37S ribosomal protein S7, mitochondrial [Wickerhamiella sorbophila]PRT56542.1 37S ribosomal protein S7, mitochondrial [Wickerhamiella sorbophila]
MLGMIRFAARRAAICPSRAGILSQNVRSASSKAADGVADFLASVNGKPEGREQADSEAKAWLEAMKELRDEFRPDNEPYKPSKVFAPEGSRDYNILIDAANKEAETFEPTLAQIAQFEALKDKAIAPMMDETMEYLVGVITRHGKKARARRYLSEALYLVYLQTRQDPVKQLKHVLEKMGPLIRMKRFSDGGARAELVPLPLSERQRMRQAWDWILEASDRRQSRSFSVRLSEEILSAIQGKSPGFEKKVTVHKTAITNRAYISLLK